MNGENEEERGRMAEVNQKAIFFIENFTVLNEFRKCHRLNKRLTNSDETECGEH